MKWKKLGLIFQPQVYDIGWMHSHAWVPTPEIIGEGLVRIYFASRNRENLSQVGALTLNLQKPKEILDVTSQPLISLGPLGSFDDSAVLPSWVLNRGSRKYLYYVGWMQGKRVPFYASIGLAESYDDGRTFKKITSGPLIERDKHDPYFTAACCVHSDEKKWRMWYTSNTAWRQLGERAMPRYCIKYAESLDGIRWNRKGQVAIDFKAETEYAISRPWVVHEDGVYKMWYSFRGEAYRIGYAESENGVEWVRKDELAGIDVSKDGWDSEMIEYAAVVTYKGQHFMFYNGNNYGYDGIGLAVEE